MKVPFDPAIAYTYGSVIEAAYRLFTPGLLDPVTTAAQLPAQYRIVNRPDIVPRLPPLYETSGTEIELDSTAYPAVAHGIACYHTLTTYLWLLNQQSVFGLGTCAHPVSGHSDPDTPSIAAA